LHLSIVVEEDVVSENDHFLASRHVLADFVQPFGVAGDLRLKLMREIDGLANGAFPVQLKWNIWIRNGQSIRL
jgi:hypothetical protein